MPKRAVLRMWWTLPVEALAAPPRPRPPFSAGVTLESVAAGVLKELSDDMAAHPDKWKTAMELPSVDTVKRILKAFWLKGPDYARQFTLVSWPLSFGGADLPWESAPHVLELMRAFPEGQRPTVGLARWLWRVVLAAPGLPLKARHVLAAHLSLAEQTGSEEMRGAVEATLLHPGAALPSDFEAPAGTPLDALMERLQASFGHALPGLRASLESRLVRGEQPSGTPLVEVHHVGDTRKKEHEEGERDGGEQG